MSATPVNALRDLLHHLEELVNVATKSLSPNSSVLLDKRHAVSSALSVMNVSIHWCVKRAPPVDSREEGTNEIILSRSSSRSRISNDAAAAMVMIALNSLASIESTAMREHASSCEYLPLSIPRFLGRTWVLKFLYRSCAHGHRYDEIEEACVTVEQWEAVEVITHHNVEV